MDVYATVEQFDLVCPDGVALEESEKLRLLEHATEDIDALTYSRIRALGGIERLTDLQRERVASVTAQLAAWRFHYADMLESPLASYSINGVSVSLSSQSIATVAGVTIPQRLYRLLLQTGLCYGGLA